MALNPEKHKIKISYDANGDAFVECVVQIRDDNGLPLENPITLKQGTPELAAFFASQQDCCRPYVASFTADAIPTIEPFNSISIIKEKCCEVQVTLRLNGDDVGIVDLPNCVKEWCPDTFQCCLDEILITGDCLDEVTVFLQRVQ